MTISSISTVSTSTATPPLRLAVLVGSVREGRVAPLVRDWFAGQLRPRADLAVDVIDIADLDLPYDYPSTQPESVAAYLARIETAEAFVVITPEYNHGYPAALKNAIDLAYVQWMAKPVSFVSYGSHGGSRAVEQLRQVFAEVHAPTMRDTVAFSRAWEAFDEQGRPEDPESSAGAAKVMVDQLLWWGLALRDAREARPYAA